MLNWEPLYSDPSQLSVYRSLRSRPLLAARLAARRYSSRGAGGGRGFERARVWAARWVRNCHRGGGLPSYAPGRVAWHEALHGSSCCEGRALRPLPAAHRGRRRESHPSPRARSAAAWPPPASACTSPLHKSQREASCRTACWPARPGCCCRGPGSELGLRERGAEGSRGGSTRRAPPSGAATDAPAALRGVVCPATFSFPHPKAAAACARAPASWCRATKGLPAYARHVKCQGSIRERPTVLSAKSGVTRGVDPPASIDQSTGSRGVSFRFGGHRCCMRGDQPVPARHEAGLTAVRVALRAGPAGPLAR
jgi:hypothetical protein